MGDHDLNITNGSILPTTIISSISDVITSRPDVTNVSLTPSGHVDARRHVALIAIETVTLCLFWLCGIFGNLMVCIVIYRSRRLQSTTNYFVVSLAIGDIFLSLFCMPFILGGVIANQWVFTSGLCKLVRVIQWLVPIACVYVMLSICVDRFYTIIYPLSFKITRTTAKNMIFFSWTVAAILSVPGFYFYGVTETDGTTQCVTFLKRSWNSILYVSALVLLSLLIPTVSIIIGYTKIFKYIWTSGVTGRTLSRTANPVPRSKIKMVKMIMIVNISYFLLIIPFLVLNMWVTLSGFHDITPSAYISVAWLVFFTTVSKPVTYWCYNSNFRRGCKEVFCMSTMKCYRGDAYAITTMSRLAKKNHIGIMDPTSDYQRVDSPSKTFDRSAMLDKTAWPLSNHIPSTYL